MAASWLPWLPVMATMAATPNAMTVMATMVVMTAMAAIINLRIFGLKKLSEMIMNYSKDGIRVSHHDQKYFCSFCNFRTHKKYNLEMYKKNKHGNSPIPPHAENEKHARKGSMTKDELRNMITESFDVFQEYMKIKMQPTGAGSEEMIEESIDAFKCYMLNQINE